MALYYTRSKSPKYQWTVLDTKKKKDTAETSYICFNRLQKKKSLIESRYKNY